MEKRLKINLNRNIGTVIYFVEGSSTEFTLLKIIFEKLLHYDYIAKKRGNPVMFVNNQCSHSRVYVINTSQSNITDISDVEFLDQVYEELINEYGLDADNAAKFYLFDRDCKSNTDKKAIERYLNILTEPYGDDTEHEKGGLLLLSYPAIESFVLSNFFDNTYEMSFELGKDVKTFIGDRINQKTVQFNKIGLETLVHAVVEYLKYVEFIGEKMDLEKLAEINKSVFEEEEKHFDITGTYRAVSKLVLSLIYLGVIEIEAAVAGC